MVRRILVQLLPQATHLVAKIGCVIVLKVDRLIGKISNVGVRDLGRSERALQSLLGEWTHRLPPRGRPALTICESDSSPNRSRKVSSRMSLRTPGAKSGP